MKTEVKKIGQTVSRLDVVVDAKDVEKDYNEILKKYRKLTVVKGFRKGKAPAALVERYYGTYITEEFNEVASDKYYKEALDVAEVNPVSPAQLADFKWDKGTDLELAFIFETNPEFELKNYLDIEIPHEKTLLSENAVSDKMNDLLETAAVLEEKEGKAEIGDEISGTLEVMDENQERVIQEKEERFIIGSNEYSEEFNDALIGKLAGDEVVARLFDKKEDADESKFMGKLTIDSIKQKSLPEMDDEFAKDLDYENLEDMKIQVEKDLQSEVDKNNKQKLKEDIFSHLIDINEFEVPQTFVRNYVNEMMKPYAGQLDDQSREQLYPMFEGNAIREVKKYYIIDKLKEEMDVVVDDEYRDNFITGLAENMNMTVEKYKKMYQERIENNEFDEAVKEAKLIDIIIERATFVPYPVEEKPAAPADEIEDAVIVEEEEK